MSMLVPPLNTRFVHTIIIINAIAKTSAVDRIRCSICATDPTYPHQTSNAPINVAAITTAYAPIADGLDFVYIVDIQQ